MLEPTNYSPQFLVLPPMSFPALIFSAGLILQLNVLFPFLSSPLLSGDRNSVGSAGSVGSSRSAGSGQSSESGHKQNGIRNNADTGKVRK